MRTLLEHGHGCIWITGGPVTLHRTRLMTNELNYTNHTCTIILDCSRNRSTGAVLYRSKPTTCSLLFLCFPPLRPLSTVYDTVPGTRESTSTVQTPPPPVITPHVETFPEDHLPSLTPNTSYRTGTSTRVQHNCHAAARALNHGETETETTQITSTRGQRQNKKQAGLRRDTT